MRFLYLSLFVATILCVIWTVSAWAICPLIQIDAFYSRHKLEILGAVGDQDSEQLMASISATIGDGARFSILLVSIPLLITTFGWFAMFVRYGQPPHQEAGTFRAHRGGDQTPSL